MMHDGNPFSTRHVRPGRMSFAFFSGLNAGELVSQLAHTGWWGQIVGPHGVGKSTLIHSLMPGLIAAGRTVSWWTLPSGQRRWPAGMSRDAQRWHRSTLVVVDGYEQLSIFARWRLRARCRRARAGLLITTHRAARLPTLLALTCPLSVVQQLVAQLLSSQPGVISPEDVARSYAAERGNVREVFFALYDLYEQRRGRTPHTPSPPASHDTDP